MAALPLIFSPVSTEDFHIVCFLSLLMTLTCGSFKHKVAPNLKNQCCARNLTRDLTDASGPSADPSNQSLIRNGLSGRAAVRKLHLRIETRLRTPNYKRTGLKTSGSRSYGVMNPTLFTILASVKMWRHFIEGSGFSLHNLIQSAVLFSLKKKRRIKLTEIHIFFIMRETLNVSQW